METNNYKFIFNHNSPSYSGMLSLQIREAYLDLNITMNVYKDNILEYFIKLFIQGHYYNNGNQNFEYNKINIIQKKDIDNDLLKDIKKELYENRIKFNNIFSNTLLETSDYLLDFICDN